ncbi:MAG: putative endonuclease [Nocardioides sp.]|nr:putative endonuclease [Nocardioides sp.]
MSYVLSPTRHPVLGCASTLAQALDAVADVDPMFMATADKQAALLELAACAARLNELSLRVLAAADDVAEQHGARDAGAWLASAAVLDDHAGRRDLALARCLERRPHLAAAMRAGTVDRDRATVVARALDALPADLTAQVTTRAELHLTTEARRFDPRRLRRLGRAVLEVVAPHVADEHERRLLEAEDARAEATTRLTTRRRGDGTTDISIRCADAVADRLLTYLAAYTSPRQDQPTDAQPWPQRLGAAFGALLEHADPERLPLHGGDATTVIVTMDLSTLLTGLGVALVGDEPISAAQARRLACTARLVPAVLDGESAVLDLGRGRRLYSRHQRKAMALRDVTCRAHGCTVPAAWCEAHHLTPWSRGGRTDLADGALLCSHHHHRAHDPRFVTTRRPDGSLRFDRPP